MVGNDEKGKSGVMKPQTLRFNCNKVQESGLGRPCCAENMGRILDSYEKCFAHQNVGSVLYGMLHISKMKSLMLTSVGCHRGRKLTLEAFR